MRICHIEATVIAVLTGRHDRDNIRSQSGNARISLSAVRFAASAPQFALAAGRSRPRRRAIGCPGRGQAPSNRRWPRMSRRYFGGLPRGGSTARGVRSGPATFAANARRHSLEQTTTAGS
jgi:hypothetical protein